MNISDFNSMFETKHNINKKEIKRNCKKSSPLVESLSKSKPLKERKWQLTIPGSYRKEVMDAGEEEDFEGVRNSLLDICDFVIGKVEDEDIEEEYNEFKDELEYVDIEDEDEANYWLNELYDLMDNTNIFLGIDESLSLNEEYAYRSMDALYELDREIEDYLNQNNFHGFIDLYDINPNDEPVPSITYHIDGDWKHEHLRFKYLVKEFLNSKDIVHMITEREYPSDSDSYEADYTIHLMKHEDDLDEGIKESKKSSMPKEIKKDIDKIIKTYGIKNIPKWRIQDIAQDNPKYSKEIWNYVSSLNEDINVPDGQYYEPGNEDSNFDIDDDSIDNYGEEPPFTESCGSKRKLKEGKKITGGSMQQEDVDVIEPLINSLDEIENNFDCFITWNFGRNKDGLMTAGIDINFNKEEDDNALNILERIFEDHGYAFDSSIGYDKNPWKPHVFGKGYHTQIIEIEDVNESLNESTDEVVVGLYGDEVDGIRSVSGLVKYFESKGLKVSDVSGDMDYGWELNVKGAPRTIFLAVQDLDIPGYTSDSVDDFISNYRIDDIDESLNESSNKYWALFFDENGIHGVGSEWAHSFNMTPANIEKKIKSKDYYLPKEAKSYIILSDPEFRRMGYDEIEKYHSRHGKTLTENTHDTLKTKKDKSYNESYDDMFFIRDEIDELAYDVLDELSSLVHDKFNLEDVYMATPTRLVLTAECEGAYHDAEVKIDLRKIRKPSDIYKYKSMLVNQLKDSYDEYNDLDESLLNEERKPKYWNSTFADKVIDAYEKGNLTFDNIKEWNKKYNGGVEPNPPFNTDEILKYYLNHGRNLSESNKQVSKGTQKRARFANRFKK